MSLLIIYDWPPFVTDERLCNLVDWISRQWPESGEILNFIIEVKLTGSIILCVCHFQLMWENLYCRQIHFLTFPVCVYLNSY
ncbi:hypothetical protein XELAEV_18020053mg [Xenopus laevis]|uniref:Uncharacterized protein n=1 Tax=Xenopus laevis TaxID=8355 RepID=A0A974HQB1_XENLA|nr:hypothetical protein XELAEV_18020053mg [Xenopus laevis]